VAGTAASTASLYPSEKSSYALGVKLLARQGCRVVGGGTSDHQWLESTRNANEERGALALLVANVVVTAFIMTITA
jgi:hypothetical protein